MIAIALLASPRLSKSPGTAWVWKIPTPLMTPFTSKLNRLAIGAGSLVRNVTYFGMLTSLGEAICNGPTMVGDASGGIGVATAAGVNEPATVGDPLGSPVAPGVPSAHALQWLEIARPVMTSHRSALGIK